MVTYFLEHPLIAINQAPRLIVLYGGRAIRPPTLSCTSDLEVELGWLLAFSYSSVVNCSAARRAIGWNIERKGIAKGALPISD